MAPSSTGHTATASGGHVPGNRVRFGLLLALLVWAPLPWGSFDRWAMLLLATALCLLAAWHLATLAITGRHLDPVTRHAGGPIVLLGLAALWQWLQVPLVSISPADTASFALLATGFAAAALLTTELVHTRQRVMILIGVLLASATFQAFFAIVRVYTDQPYTLFGAEGRPNNVTEGTFFNRNHFAAYMVIALSLGIGVMIAKLGEAGRNWRDRLRNLANLVLEGKAGLRILLVILVIALIMTRSRMGNIGFFVSLSVAAVVWAAISRRLTRGFVLFLVSVIVLDLVLIGSYFGVEQVRQRVQETTLVTEARDNVAASALPLVREEGLLGTGGGTFMLAFMPYRTPDIAGLYTHAHNDYVQIVAELGVPGALLLGGAWLWWLTRGVRTIGSRDKWFRGMAFAGCMLPLYAAIHASVEFNLYIPAVALTLVVALSVTGGVVPALREVSKAPRRRGGRRDASPEDDASERTRSRRRPQARREPTAA